jgi:hypothetical protein
VAAVVDLLAVLGPAEPLKQFVVGEVKGGKFVCGTGFGTNHGPTAQNCHFDGQLVAGLPGIGLLGDFRVDPLDLVAQRFDLCDFFPGIFAEPV